MKVYIIGKVGDVSSKKRHALVYLKFMQHEQRLEDIGYEVVNPMRIVPFGTGWKEAMLICIPAMLRCEAVAPLPDWKKSRGGKIELRIAADFNLTAVFLSKMNE